MQLRFRSSLLRLTTALLSSATLTSAALGLDLSGMDAKQAAHAVFVHAEQYHRGWGSGHSEGKMLLRDADGEQSAVPLESWALEGEPYEATKKKVDAGATFIKYDSDGTGLVTFMYRNADDLQWVWVPSLKKRMRINTRGLTGSFVGSEFAIEDLRSQLPEKYKSKLLSEEPCGQVLENEQEVELNCWKFERLPLAKKTGYSRMITWVDQQHFRVIKTVFYDRNKTLLKTLEARNWSLLQDKYWRADFSEMSNHQTGRVSVLQPEVVELDIGLKKADFDANRRLLR